MLWNKWESKYVQILNVICKNLKETTADIRKSLCAKLYNLCNFVSPKKFQKLKDFKNYIFNFELMCLTHFSTDFDQLVLKSKLDYASLKAKEIL